MSISTRFVTVVMAAVSLIGFGTGSAAAEAGNGDMVPLSSILRACDSSETEYVSATGFGSGQAFIGTGGSNTVTAEVRLGIGKPNTPYNVRVIQVPRPRSQPCNAGDPGVLAGVLNTDGNGTGSVTLRGSLRPGATGAWAFVEGSPDPGQIRGEFYTSDVVTSLT
ncbi:MAG: hypothetical protein ACRDU5_03465 [Mycobacterium sp.]